MKTRLIALAAAVCLCLPSAAAADAPALAHSGALKLEKPSQAEISQLLAACPLEVEGASMAQAPSLQAPYTLGEVSELALEGGLNRLNALRRLAGLPAVRLDGELSQRAQYAAVLLAAGGELTHTPERPGDMSEDFYNLGLDAAQRSNLCMSTEDSLPVAVEAFFDDSDGGNLPTLGHRRWVLNPAMSKTGLGFAPGGAEGQGAGYHFTALWAFDAAGDEVDYDFIAWPASGSFPNSVFAPHEAWSVTLSPERYAVPQAAELTVTLTRASDGREWVFPGEETYTPGDTGRYFGVDHKSYGVANCIIFRPDLEEESYEGTYTVSIRGLRTAAGEEAELRYQVEFFTPTAVDVSTGGTSSGGTSSGGASSEGTSSGGDAGASGSGEGTAGTGTEEVQIYSDVPVDSWFGEAVNYATRLGLFQGVGGDRFDPKGKMTRAMAMMVLARMDGADVAARKGEKWDLRARRWAVSNRISDGVDAGEPIPLEELAEMLYRYAALKGVAEDSYNYHLAGMPDGDSVTEAYVNAVNWAVDVGILYGDEAGRLNPQRTVTRAQTAVMLRRYLLIFR